VETVPEFITYAKANPDKVNFGSGGSGSSVHMAGELFKMLTGVSMVQCRIARKRSRFPICSRPAAGHFPTMAASVEYVRAERLRRSQ